jgi:hypothetical protein
VKRIYALAALLVLLGCTSADRVRIQKPLGSFGPDEPSRLHGIIEDIREDLGVMMVRVDKVDGSDRMVAATIYIDQSTAFYNNSRVRMSTWTQLSGAEVDITGWYRGQDYYADEVTVLEANPEDDPLRRNAPRRP